MIPAILPTYSRAPLSFVRGEGAWLWTQDGTRYLDLGAGIAVNALGHAHPALVAGEGRACTSLMRHLKGAAAVKTGAEGVFGAILPGLGLGVALKIDDGATRASESVMAALLVRLGLGSAEDPEIARWRAPVQRNRRDIEVGRIRPVAAIS